MSHELKTSNEQSNSKISNDQSKFKKDASKEGIRGSMSIGHSLFVRVHSRKRINEDQIKLGGDRPGGTIENEASERGVQLGEPNKDSLATSGCPFWYLLD